MFAASSWAIARRVFCSTLRLIASIWIEWARWSAK
jgi:hypothetical protein